MEDLILIMRKLSQAKGMLECSLRRYHEVFSATHSGAPISDTDRAATASFLIACSLRYDQIVDEALECASKLATTMRVQLDTVIEPSDLRETSPCPSEGAVSHLRRIM